MRKMVAPCVCLAVILALLLAAFGPVPRAAAHDGTKTLAVGLDASRPAPSVDGRCDLAEYALSRTYSIYYEPRLPGR